MSRIIAIDPGTSCGWAVWNSATDIIRHGVWHLRSHDESEDVRLMRLHASLNRFQKPADLLVYEANKDQRFSRSVRIYGQIEGALMLWARQQAPAVPFIGENPSTILKWLCGGKYVKQLKAWRIWAKTHKEPKPSFKDLKRHYAYEKWNFTCETTDEMDAYILAQYAKAVLAPRLGLGGRVSG